MTTHAISQSLISNSSAPNPLNADRLMEITSRPAAVMTRGEGCLLFPNSVMILAGAPLAGVGFEAPLGEGDYVYLVQQTGQETSGYSYEMVLEPVAVAAAEVERVGTPANPSAFLPGQTSAPVLGATWDPVVDHTSFVPGAAADFVLITGGPFNLSLGTPGTLLCDITSPLFLFETAPAPGAPFALPVPNNCPLAGVQICAQGGSIDGALQPHLANALDVTIGTF